MLPPRWQGYFMSEALEDGRDGFAGFRKERLVVAPLVNRETFKQESF
jgi:hypothetical protein